MPTIMKVGPYRFFFYSFDCNEPMHVHVQRDRAVCKFWIQPLVLNSSHGFPAHELHRIRTIIKSNLNQIIEAWHEHCG
ncbi:conserved hypothetical protein [Beggiatoa sp. PS]|nr:conserved hypothetical protein [Beggiatoa sp. PS]